MLQILKSDDPQLSDLIARLQTLHGKFKIAEAKPTSEFDDAIEVEYHTLLNNDRRLQRAYLLRYTAEMRENAIKALQQFAMLSQNRQLSEEETIRLRRVQENVRKLDSLEARVR